jgi:hypothetical protein
MRLDRMPVEEEGRLRDDFFAKITLDDENID